MNSRNEASLEIWKFAMTAEVLLNFDVRRSSRIILETGRVADMSRRDFAAPLNEGLVCALASLGPMTPARDRPCHVRFAIANFRGCHRIGCRSRAPNRLGGEVGHDEYARTPSRRRSSSLYCRSRPRS
jgi:hypothetical protein